MGTKSGKQVEPLLPDARNAVFLWLLGPEIGRFFPQQPVFVAAGYKLVGSDLLAPPTTFPG